MIVKYKHFKKPLERNAYPDPQLLTFSEYGAAMQFPPSNRPPHIAPPTLTPPPSTLPPSLS